MRRAWGVLPLHRQRRVKGRDLRPHDLKSQWGSQLTNDKAECLGLGLTWRLSFSRQESAGGRTAGSVGGGAGQSGRSHRSRTGDLDRWRVTSPQKGHGLRNGDVWPIGEGCGFRSKCRLAVSRTHAKSFWEVCPKRGKRKAEEPSFRKCRLDRTR